MGDVKKGHASLAAFMEQEILDCLAELGAPAVTAGHKVSSPDVSFKAHEEPDMVMDPINSAQVGSDPEHFVTISPEPEDVYGGAVTSEAIWDVPITPARPTNEIDATETVIHSASGTDAGFASFLNITKSANSDARRAGSLAASVSYTLGYDGATTQHGSPVAIATRITSAKLAASQGATASAMPSQFPIDVVWTRIGDVASAEDANADYHSVYLPSALSPAEMSALLSLLVEGGPGAYTWRYRPAPAPDEGAVVPGDRRAAYMPSVVRHLHPGGFNQLLAVTERDVLLPPVGGGSLTYAALDALERHYRLVWGHDTFDAAWRSTFASAAVYVAPIASTADQIRPGENFELLETTHVLDGENMHHGRFTWTGPQGRPAPDADLAYPTDAHDWGEEGGRAQRRLGLVVWGIARGRDPGLPFNFNAGIFDGGGAQYQYRAPNAHAGAELRIGWEEIIGLLAGLTARTRRFVHAAMLYYTHRRMSDTLAGAHDAEGDSIDATTNLRNVYGARDHVKLSLARLRMFEVVGLLAHYTTPTRRVAMHSSLSRADMKGRARNYVGHLHLANFFAFFREDFWPCDVKTFGRAHSAFLRHVPAALRAYCWMGRIEPEGYPEQNWLLLEAPYLIRGAESDSAFVGHLVPGTWPVRTDGIIDLTDARVNLAAVDAAYRASVNENGLIAADGRFGQTSFKMVRNTKGTVNPLAFAPRIDTVRGTAGVSLMHDKGPATFQAGGNYGAPLVSVR